MSKNNLTPPPKPRLKPRAEGNDIPDLNLHPADEIQQTSNSTARFDQDGFAIPTIRRPSHQQLQTQTQQPEQ